MSQIDAVEAADQSSLATEQIEMLQTLFTSIIKELTPHVNEVEGCRQAKELAGIGEYLAMKCAGEFQQDCDKYLAMVQVEKRPAPQAA